MTRARNPDFLQKYPAVFWTGEIDEEHFKEVQETIDGLREAKKIVLFIASGGGFMPPALAFYNWVRALRIPLITVAAGEVASAAIIVFLAGQKRFVSPHSYLRIHSIRASMAKDADILPSELSGIEADLKAAHDIYVNICVRETRLGTEEINNFMAGETVIRPKQSVKWGFAHGILDL